MVGVGQMTSYGDDNKDKKWYSFDSWKKFDFWKNFDYKKLIGFLNAGGSGDDDDNGVIHDDVDQSPIDHASISFNIGTRELDYNGKDSQQNIIDQCIFSSEQFFEPLCIKCKFLDDDGTTVVAKGQVIDLDQSYTPNTEIPILMTSVPEVEDGYPANNDVRNVHGVKLTICGFDCEPVFADFTTLKHGAKESVINTAMASAGISVSAVANTGGYSQVIIFDGDTEGGPTDTNAQPDPDLRADGNTGDMDLQDGICPDCAGKHFLIIPENIINANGDDYIDIPDDSAKGGTIKVEMDTPMFLKSFVLADLENNQYSKAVAYDSSNNPIKTISPLPATGDGKLLTINMNAANTKRLEVTYKDSGGITNIDLKCEPPNNEGCTPGFWKQKQHFKFWKGYGQSDIFSTTFGISDAYDDLTIKVDNQNKELKEVSLLKALQAQGGGLNALARHAVAALLNAASGANYAFTVDEVKMMVKNAIESGSYEHTKNILEEENERGCPFGNDDCDCEDRKDHYYTYYDNHKKYYDDNKKKFKSSDYKKYMDEHKKYLNDYGKYMDKSDYKMHTDYFKKFLDDNKKKFSSSDYKKYSNDHKKYSNDYKNHSDSCTCDDDRDKDHYDKDDDDKDDKDYKYKYGKDHDD